MISKYGYCPFGTDAALIKMAGNVVAAHNSQHRFFSRFHETMLVPSEGAKSLAVVGKDQQLYVFAHGIIGDHRLHSDQKGGHGTLTVTEVAQQLKAQGLTLAIKKVKMWVCNSGRDDAAGKSTAAYFTLAMRAEGFNAAVIIGYTLSLMDQVNLAGVKVGIAREEEVRVDGVKAELTRRAAVVQAAEQSEGIRGLDSMFFPDDLDAEIEARGRSGAVAGATAAPARLAALETRTRESAKISSRTIRVIHAPLPIGGPARVAPPKPVRAA